MALNIYWAVLGAGAFLSLALLTSPFWRRLGREAPWALLIVLAVAGIVVDAQPVGA